MILFYLRELTYAGTLTNNTNYCVPRHNIEEPPLINIKGKGNEQMQEAMLTTDDNPFDPFTEFDAWFQFDVSHGYHTLSYLARIAITSPELSDADELLAIEQAIDEIIRENPLNYKKVTREYVPIQVPFED